MLLRMSSSVSGGRSAVRPEGSPILAVMSPTMKTTWCPIRWNRLAMIIGTAWPTCTSAAVGSVPNFTTKLRPPLAEQFEDLGERRSFAQFWRVAQDGHERGMGGTEPGACGDHRGFLIQ